MKFPPKIKIFRGHLDAAPFISVLMLLLLFLLFQSQLVFVPGVPIRLPEAPPLPGPETPTLVVAVDERGRFFFANQLCDEADLREKLRFAASAKPRPTLVVQADRSVTYETVVRLGLLARDAGLKEVLWATRPQPTPMATSP
jgi:biopolymer transport protein ExbD